MCVRERQRETDRDRQTNRQTDRQTDREVLHHNYVKPGNVGKCITSVSFKLEFGSGKSGFQAESADSDTNAPTTTTHETQYTA